MTLPIEASANANPNKANANACANRSNNNIDKLLDCVSYEGVRRHQEALQQIADESGGIRASGFPGYDASVDYVVEQLTAAGYDPVVQPFDFVIYAELALATLEQISPAPTTYVYGDDFLTMSYSGSTGNVPISGAVTPVDLSLGDPAASTSGCEVADFAGFAAGTIALIQRGACTFQLKAENAEAAGAIGVIIFNQGTAGREPLFGGTLSDGYVGDLPVVSMPFDLGAELAGTPGLELAISTSTLRSPFTTTNVLAETSSGDPDNVVMVGAHLDSVQAGPGIQDNGSGTAAILETAIQMAKADVRNKVRFAWWGAEESGLIGSTFYVNDLINKFFDEGDETILKIALYLNFDMIGSPNYVFKIYDGDDSDGEGAGPGPEGSAQIEAFFERFYEGIGEPYKGTDFSGRSDYGPFITLAGIPAGGLFTGAEELKTEEEAAIWGGVVGEQLDQCYHLACDTFDNISEKALTVNADAVAASTLYYAMNTSEINGVEGKGNFKSAGKALRKYENGIMEQTGHFFTK
ncbi:M28 family peptidase [Sulfitobacter sp. D35]|nr:M28 family peptidase [Sulfitobacter sp. D35]